MITRDLEMRRGDLMPDLVLDVLDKGIPVDLSTATAVKVLGKKNGALFINRAASSFSDEGVVTMLWQPGDTSTPGTIYFEVEATWPGVRPQTFRATNKVVVLPDFG